MRLFKQSLPKKLRVLLLETGATHPATTGAGAGTHGTEFSQLSGLAPAGDAYAPSLGHFRSCDSGALGLLHIADAGYPNLDFRSYTGPGSPVRNQITIR